MSQVRRKIKGQEQESFLGLVGFVGGGFLGLREAVRLLYSGQLYVGPISIVLLMVIGVGFPGLLGFCTATVCRWVGRTRVTTFWISMFGVLSLFLAEWWFTAPPPFAFQAPLQGNEFVFVAFVVVVFVPLTWLLSRLSGWVPFGFLLAWTVMEAFILLRGPTESAQVTLAADAPNLLFVSLDTVRADRFLRGRQQNFERVAAKGVRFHTAISSIPVTGPSHMSLMTGVAPWEHGVMLNGGRLPDQYGTLAESLGKAGYSTGAFVSAYVLNKSSGLARGFDVYGDHFGWLRGLDVLLVGRLWEGSLRFQDPFRILERRAAETVDEAISWVHLQQRPWFAWVHLFDPHGPYTPPPPYDNRYYQGYDKRAASNRSMEQVSGVPEYMSPFLEGITDVAWVTAQYDGEIGYTDGEIGRFLDWIEVAAPNTIVVIVGDHGEGLGEHGEWFRHGDFLYEQDLKVPMAMRWPGKIAPGTEVASPVASYGLYPTVLDYMLPGQEARTGSLRPVIEGGSAPSEIVHAVCLDREANQLERSHNVDFKPKWRMASSWSAGQLYVVRESPRMEDALFLVSGAEAPGGEESGTNRLKQSAASILTGSSFELPELPSGERALLEALGYIDPSRRDP